MKKGWAITISIIFSMLLGVHILLSFVLSVGLDKDIYKDAQIKDEIYSYAGLSQESLDVATKTLIDYMQDDRDNLDEWNIDNNNFEYFNAREKAHMVDVKDLFILAKGINFAIFLILIIILVFYLVFDKKGMFKYFFKFSFMTLLISIGVMLVVSIFIMIDFGRFWTFFHEIFFRNDLWLLNPKTDLLIRMMPERFFVRIVINILIRFGIAYFTTMAVLFTTHTLLNVKKKSESGRRAER
jgi:integral membrane protein (TIGR01906 family)